MFDEIKKSLTNVLAERTVSPFFGTLIISWSLWNWKIIYFLLGSDGSVGIEKRLEIIENKYTNIYDLYLLPFLFSSILIIIFPLISNFAYFIWLKYDIWKKNIRNNVEKNELLSIDDSIKIRLEIKETNDKLSKLITEKELEIENLKKEILLYKSMSENENKSGKNAKSIPRLSSVNLDDFNTQLKENPDLNESLRQVFWGIKNKRPFNDTVASINKNHVEYFRINNIISEDVNGYIQIGSYGSKSYKDYLEKEIQNDKK